MGDGTKSRGPWRSRRVGEVKGEQLFCIVIPVAAITRTCLQCCYSHCDGIDSVVTSEHMPEART